MKSSSVQIVVLVLAALCLSCVTASAQSKSKSKSGSSGGSGGSGTGTANSEDGASGLGFSIETEMFTYQAVESNSRVIACDIAQYLYGGQLASAGSGSHAPCVVENQNQGSPGVVLVSADSTLLADFQIWRTDMAMMNSLEQRADQVCVANPQESHKDQGAAPSQSGGGGLVARGLLGDIIANASPAAAAASTASQFMSMLGKSQSVTSVVGTVQDPALLNEVGRQLRALNVQVLIPEMYNPGALGGADYTHSPYMGNLQKLFEDYDKCTGAKSSYGPDPAKSASITSVLAEMDGFLKSAFATAGTQVPAEAAPQTPGAAPTAPPTAPASPNSPTESHFAAVLAADQLAQEMGFSGTGSAGSNTTWQHLVWLEALESGGSVEKEGGLFGSKVYFGGGAVDTYSVFRFDGQLVCAGNVYNFQPPVRMDNLEKTFQKGLSDDPTKSPLLQSTCGALPPAVQR